MYKSELVRRVSRETRLSQRIVSDVVNESLKTVQAVLRDGQNVVFPGFGSFYTSDRKEGRVRHIRTHQTVTVPARRVAAFRVGETLKKAVRNSTGEKAGKRGRKSLRG